MTSGVGQMKNGAQIFERRREETREAARMADSIASPFVNPEALYVLRRRQCGHMGSDGAAWGNDEGQA